jgi:hypothetical protein
MRRLLLPTLVLAQAAAACSGIIGDPNDLGSSGDPGAPQTTALPQPRLRLLLARQYRNAVRDLLGDGAATAVAPPPDTEVNGFEAIGASQLAVNDDSVGKYEASAIAAGAAAMGDIDRINGYVDCAPAAADDAACHSHFIARFGRLAWRRALDDDEIARYTSIGVASAKAYNDFYAGVSYTIAALLQSPHFVYQVELGATDPQNDQVRVLNGYEIAARMSFFLLDTTPSPELLDQAEAGALDTADGVRETARALLEQPAAHEALRGYYDELFRLRALASLPKDAGAYPAFTGELATAMREETLLLIDEVVWQDGGDFRDFFDSDHTFVNPELAAFYGVDAPSPDGFAPASLPPEQKRGGFFGHASFLASYAHASGSSPTLRGKFVRERILCQNIPAPPAGVITVLPSDAEAKTAREKLEMHQKNPSCASCHVKMDNVGLGLENYDGIGAYRTLENGETIDPVSDLDGVPFDGAASLGKALRDHPDVPGCIVRNLYRHASGHVETKGEREAMTDLEDAFVESGYRLTEALVEIVASDAFRHAGPLDQ